MPEYRSISGEEFLLNQRRAAVDHEYTSYELAYAPSDEAELAFRLNPKSFLYSVGSVGGKRFLVDGRLRVESMLNDRVRLRVIYFDQSDLDSDQRHFLYEMGYRVGRFEFSAYAQLAYAKKFNDVGAAVTYWVNDQHSIRAFVTEMDFQRNVRNDESDRFGIYPWAVGLVGRKVHADRLLEYVLRLDPHFTWSVPQETTNYSQSRWMASLYAILPNGSDSRWAFRAQVDHRNESFEDQTSLVTTDLDTRRTQAYVRYRRARAWGRADVEPGLWFAHRQWTERSQQDVIPHVRIHFASDTASRWSVSYEPTLSWGWGNRTASQRSTSHQHRSNVWWSYRFNPEAELKLAFTFDLDRFGTDDTWEGGNGQFAWTF